MAAFSSRVLADSISPDGHRLTTFEVTFPQMVLRDMTRHRVLSYSFESTRAVPVVKRIKQARDNPYIPTFMQAAKGMGGGEPLTHEEQQRVQAKWRTAAQVAADYAEFMLPYSKEHVGRILEPYTWITGIVSGTEWDNFWHLRCPPEGAEPDPKYPPQIELQIIAQMMRNGYEESAPLPLEYGEWHLPLVPLESEWCEARETGNWMYWAGVSAGRCATVSYAKHHLNEPHEPAYQRWVDKLAPFSHWSPGEHPAECVPAGKGTAPANSNFTGFKQLRKTYPDERIAKPYQIV